MNKKVIIVMTATLIALAVGRILFLRFVLLGAFYSNSNNKKTNDSSSQSYNNGPPSSLSTATSTHIIIGSGLFVSVIIILAVIGFKCENICEHLQRERRSTHTASPPSYPHPHLTQDSNRATYQLQAPWG